MTYRELSKMQLNERWTIIFYFPVRPSVTRSVDIKLCLPEALKIMNLQLPSNRRALHSVINLMYLSTYGQSSTAIQEDSVSTYIDTPEGHQRHWNECRKLKEMRTRLLKAWNAWKAIWWSSINNSPLPAQTQLTNLIARSNKEKPYFNKTWNAGNVFLRSTDILDYKLYTE